MTTVQKQFPQLIPLRTTSQHYLFRFFWIVLLASSHTSMGWAQSILDSSRIRSLQVILPYLDQLETIQETVRKDTATFIGMQFILDINTTWLQQARFGTTVLSIRVEQKSPQLLHIGIEDSGIGIEEAQRRQQNRDPNRGHQGMTMTNQRINWLNVGKSEKIVLRIQDRSQLSPPHTGTLVQLSIPL